MHLSGFDRAAAAATLTGDVLILLVLFARRRARSFPIFTALIAVELTSGFIGNLVLAHFSLNAYKYTYWSMGILDEVLQILVFYEIAVHVFCPTGVWARDVRRTFLGMSAISVVVAFLLAWLAQPAALRPIVTFILRSNFFSSALMSEVFVGMVVLASTVGLPWKTHAARIAQGLGAYSLLCLAIDIVTNYVGVADMAHVHLHLSQLTSLTWIGCEMYWVVTLWAEAPVPRELPEAMRIQIYSLNRWVENDLIRIRAWRRN
jgi:hypothetical protein